MTNHEIISIDQRLAFHRITSQDLLSLKDFKQLVEPVLEEILDSLYAHLRSDSVASDLFQNDIMMQRAKAAQLKHWRDRVFSGQFDEHYVDAVRRINLAHLKVGVHLWLYVGSYSFILNEFRAYLTEKLRNDVSRLKHVMTAAHKAIFLDMEIAVSAFAEYSTQMFREMSLTDQLTNVPNRRAIQVTGDRVFAEARRYGHKLSLAMLDLDEFKKINDTYGHLVGDDVLCHVTECMRDTFRSSDYFGRWGGEEFLILFPSTSSKRIKKPLQRLLEEIRTTPIPTDQGDILVTASIGVAEICGDDESFEHLVHRADVALYQAKNFGRDRLVAV